jgi:hypothetical protein
MVPDPQTSKGGAAILLWKNTFSSASPFVIPKIAEKKRFSYSALAIMRRGIHKGALLARSAPYVAFFGYFLGETRKYRCRQAFKTYKWPMTAKIPLG